MNRIVCVAFALAFALGAQAQAATTAVTTICKTVAACVLDFNQGPGPGGAGLEALGLDSVGVFASSNYNFGVLGRSEKSYGIVGVALGGTGVAGVYGQDLSGYNTTDIGVLGSSSEGTAIEALTAYGYEFQAINNSFGTASVVASIDSGGNEVLTGGLTEFGTPFVRTHSTNGQDLTTYGARSSSPTLEDFGTATMRDGVATVALDKAFASTIAPGYMVFVTPHGDSNSLYTVPSKSGFTVRESKGGRSTLTFDYRIVARPLDAAKATRLAVMAAPAKHALPKVVSPR